MTVEELIDELKKYDGKMQVRVWDYCPETLSGYHSEDVDVVDLEDDGEEYILIT